MQRRKGRIILNEKAESLSSAVCRDRGDVGCRAEGETSEGEINKGAEGSQSQSISCKAHDHDQRAAKQSRRAVKRCLCCLVDCCLGRCWICGR